MPGCRIALTISGAIALGAYEGGALAALLVGVQRLLREPEPPVRIDVVAGASAGSITGLLATRALLNGYDPVHLMEEAWVRRPQLETLLRDAGNDAPLSVKALEDMAAELLDPPAAHRVDVQQQVPIAVHMTLANLQGLHYRIPASGKPGRPPLPASTYIDWGRFTFHPGDPVSAYTEPPGAAAVTVALASGANAIGFPPKLLNRRLRADRQDPEDYDDHAITNVPADGLLWYTDGGTIDNEPVGRTLELVHRVDRGTEPWAARREDEERMMLLVHPHPTAPAGRSAWAGPRQPGWVQTLLRALKLQTSQSLFADLREVSRTNSRLRWSNELCEAVSHQLSSLTPDQAAEWSQALGELLERIDADKRRIRAQAGRKPGVTVERHEDSPAVLFNELVEVVTGLGGKSVVSVEEITPEILLDDAQVPGGKPVTVEDLLSGEFLAHFGGFLHEPLRRSDFDLGYRSTLQWMEQGLAGTGTSGLSPDHVAMALEAATDRYRPGPLVARPGPPDLPWRARLAVARVLGRVARVAVVERLGRR